MMFNFDHLMKVNCVQTPYMDKKILKNKKKVIGLKENVHTFKDNERNNDKHKSKTVD